MARGPASSLFRAYASKKNVSRIRVFFCNQYTTSFGRHDRGASQNLLLCPAFDVPNRPFSTNSISPPRLGLTSQRQGFLGPDNFLVKPFSSVVQDGDEDVNDNREGGSSAALVGSECEFDADSGKSIDFEHESEVTDEQYGGSEDYDSAMVELENVVEDGESVVNSEGHVHVASRDPSELYCELCDAKNGVKLRRLEWDTLIEIFGVMSRSGWASDQALAIYIGKAFFPTAVQKFRKFFFLKCSADVVKYLVSLGPSDAAVKFLFPIFVEYCLKEFPDEIKQFRSMIESADLTKPHTWFPFARAMKRKIIYHCGPTNSGKTYNALQRFMDAKKGLYCSPLRLLAMEVFDKVNALGVYCSLQTGQEKKYVPFSNHVSCTVEMVSTDELYDIAVIDEIQMMADPNRGYAWTRALLGLKADEIHLCGDPSVLNIVRKICSDTGDELYEQHYERFKPLVVEAKTLLGDLRNVRSGDCVVAFSRREIFEVKMAIEKYTNHRCCVIYGALPPETRRQQANLFNDQDNEFDVLVASDAVGMGLNLNIRRVVFYSISKYNGDKVVPVSASQVKQIAGRAGRRGSIYPDGLTTTLHLNDLDYLIECLKQPFDDVKKVGLFPFFEQVELFAGQLHNVTFCELLEKFGQNCRLDGSYFLCRHDHIKKVANMLEKVQGLSLENRFNFCFAPVNIRDPKAMHHLLRFASSYSQNIPVNVYMGMPKASASNDAELLDLESKHQVLSMYLWLSQHFEREQFPYVQKAETMATDIAGLLSESLVKANWKPEARKTGKPMPQQKADGFERPRSLIKLKDK